MRKKLWSAALLMLIAQNCLAAACGPVYGADSIAEDKEGKLWIAHYEDARLGKLDPSSGRFFEYLPKTQANPSVLNRNTWNQQEGFSYQADTGFNGLALDNQRGLVWTLVFNSDRLSRFSQSDNRFTEIKLPGRGFGRFNLPIDAAGNVWLLSGPCCGQTGDMHLVKVSPDASQQTFKLPVKRAIALSLILNRQGDAWISLTADDEKQASLYAFKNQQFERIALPAEIGQHIAYLQVDAKNDLWLAEGHSIWRMRDQSFKRFEMPGAHPSVLSSDARGNLWFTEWPGNKIGRISADEAIQEFPIPPEEENPIALNVASDGSVWFSTMFNYDLFRLDPDTGKIKSFPLPTPSNWSKNAAEGISMCFIKPKDAFSIKSSQMPVKLTSAGQPLRHAKGYPKNKAAVEFEQNCHTSCHSWYRVDKASSRRSDWGPTVERMIGANHAPIEAPLKQRIIHYMNRNYAKVKP